MKILELFCGTKSFSKVANKLGYQTMTLDIDKRFNPDICIDLFYIDNFIMQQFKIYEPDIIWASPPCECFSVATIGGNWNRDYTPKTHKAKISLMLIDKTIRLINELKPKYWFIENPRGMLRKLIDGYFLKYDIEYIRRTVTYCQYGDTRMKPTDIWTNCYDWIPRQICRNGDPCHEKAPRGSKTGTQGIKGKITRSIVPKGLCFEILKLLKEGE